MTPLAPTSESELLTRSTSVPVGASSIMVVWKVDEVKTGTLSFMSLTRTVTVPVPLRDGEPEVVKKETKKNSERNVNFPKTKVTLGVNFHTASLVTMGQISTITWTHHRPLADPLPLDKLSAARSTRGLIDDPQTPFFFFCSSGCRLEFPSAAKSARAAVPEHIKRAQRLWNPNLSTILPRDPGTSAGFHFHSLWIYFKVNGCRAGDCATWASQKCYFQQKVSQSTPLPPFPQRLWSRWRHGGLLAPPQGQI